MKRLIYYDEDGLIHPADGLGALREGDSLYLRGSERIGSVIKIVSSTAKIAEVELTELRASTAPRSAPASHAAAS
jgi:hypothetical protein